MRDMINTSGGTFTILLSAVRGIKNDVPSGVNTVLGFKKRAVSMMSGLVTTASASANARECSKMVMPAS
jgi:hypothetical protein